MADKNFFLGMDAKLYFSATLLDDALAATVRAHAWTEASNVRDLNVNLSTGEADITTRGNNGWEATAATLKSGEVTFEMIARPGDPFLTAVKDAWLAGGEIAGWALTGDKDSADSEGPSSNFTVADFSRAEQLREAIRYSVTLKPSSMTGWTAGEDPA